MKGIKNIRLKHYDYSGNGYYFVTICTNFKQPTLHNAKVKNIVVAEIALLKKRFSGLDIDCFVIMPDHIHVIFILKDSDKTLPQIVQAFKSITTVKAKQSLDVVADLGLHGKNANVVAELARHEIANQGWRLQNKKAKQSLPLQIGKHLWQPNYYEHVIRNEDALSKIREYIQNNPMVDRIDFEQFYKTADKSACYKKTFGKEAKNSSE